MVTDPHIKHIFSQVYSSFMYKYNNVYTPQERAKSQGNLLIYENIRIELNKEDCDLSKVSELNKQIS